MLAEYYYCAVFIVLAIFQEKIEGFVVSMTCGIMAVFGETFINYIMSLGFQQYLANSTLDLVFIFIGISLITTRLGLVLTITCTISFVINIFYQLTITTSSKAYPLIYPYYTTLNVILFEILLYACLVHSKVIPYLTKKYPKYFGFLRKFVKVDGEKNNVIRDTD